MVRGRRELRPLADNSVFRSIIRVYKREALTSMGSLSRSSFRLARGWAVLSPAALVFNAMGRLGAVESWVEHAAAPSVSIQLRIEVRSMTSCFQHVSRRSTMVEGILRFDRLTGSSPALIE